MNWRVKLGLAGCLAAWVPSIWLIGTTDPYSPERNLGTFGMVFGMALVVLSVLWDKTK